MCKPKNLYNFLAFAKSCSCDLACNYVKKKNYGHNVDDLLNKLLLIEGYIDDIESYIYTSCKDYYKDGVKFFQGKRIMVSENNSLYLLSKEEKVKIESSSVNCLTEDEICELASRLKMICSNC